MWWGGVAGMSSKVCFCAAATVRGSLVPCSRATPCPSPDCSGGRHTWLPERWTSQPAPADPGDTVISPHRLLKVAPHNSHKPAPDTAHQAAQAQTLCCYQRQAWLPPTWMACCSSVRVVCSVLSSWLKRSSSWRRTTPRELTCPAPQLRHMTCLGHRQCRTGQPSHQPGADRNMLEVDHSREQRGVALRSRMQDNLQVFRG